MRALLLAAGRQQRWVENGGVGYKQLVEIDGEPLIRRAYRMIFDRCPDVVTLVDRPSLRIWDGLNARKPAHEAWMGEMGKFLDGKPHWPDNGEVVILYGDTYYTDACLDVIFGAEITQPTIFGRTRARRAESFAIRFDVERDAAEVERVAKACADKDLNRRGGPWRWFFYRHTGETNYDVARVRELATPANGWIETPNDATDDFDKPSQLEAWRKQFGTREGRPIVAKEIATKRIYGIDRHGREVLVAAPGQPIPDGFRQKAPVMDMAQRGPEVERDATPELARLTVPQLREMARRRDIEGTDSMRKAELIHALAD